MLASPYLSALQVLHDEVYGGDPTPGFKLRATIIGLLTGSYIIMSIALLLIFIEMTRKKNGGPGLWVWRRTSLPVAEGGTSGRSVILLNVKLLTLPLVTLEGIFMLIWLGYETSLHLYDGALGWHYGLVAFGCSPICAVGWIISIGTLSATLFTLPADKQAKYAGPISYLFTYGSAGLTLLLFSGAILVTVAGDRYVTSYESLSAYLREAQKDYAQTDYRVSSTDHVIDLEQQNFVRARELLRIAYVYQYSSLPFFNLVVVAVNTSALTLSRILQRHINDARSQLARRRDSRSETPEMIPLDRFDSLATSGKSGGLESSTKGGEDRGRRLSLPAIPMSMKGVRRLAMARQINTSPSIRKEAVRILELEKTKKDLQILAFKILLLSFGAFIITIYLAVGCGFGTVFNGKWRTFESAWYSFAWVLAGTYVPIGLWLLYVQLKARSVWKRRSVSNVVLIQQEVQEDIDEATTGQSRK